MTLTFRLKTTFIAALWGIFCNIGYSQSPTNSVLTDSLFSQPSFMGFMKKQLTQLGLLEKDALLSNLSVFSMPEKQKSKNINGSVGIEFFWNQGDTLLYGNAANQSFAYFTPDVNFSVLGLPVKAGANLVFQNQNWRRDLSTYTFQLDYEALLAKKKQELSDLALKEKMKTWSKEDREIWANRTKWDALYTVVHSPNFQQTKKSLEHQLDSLKNTASGLTKPANEWAYMEEMVKDSADLLKNLEGVLKDSTGVLIDSMGILTDSTMASRVKKAEKLKKATIELVKSGEELKKKATGWTENTRQKKVDLENQIKNYTNSEQQIKQLQSYYAKHTEAFERADSLRESVNKRQLEWTKLKTNGSKLKTENFKGMAMEKLQKFMGSVQQLEIGSVLLTNSDLTVRSVLLNGLRLQTQTGKYYNEIVLGKQNTATRDYAIGFQTINGTQDINRNILYFRGGIGSRDSNFLHISATRILDNFKDPQHTIQRPHYNDLLGISMREKLTKKVDLTTEMAYSLYQNNATVNWASSPELGTTLQKPVDFSACQIRLKAADENSWQWSLGYDYIGAKFTSLGNPYLLNNRQILRGALSKRFWQQKINLKLGYDKNIRLPNTNNGQPSVDQTGFSAEMGIHYGRSNQFVAKLSPRYFLLSAAGGINGVGRNDVYTIQNTWQGKICKMRWLSFINLTNINTLMPMRDSGQLSGFNYIFIQKMLIISNKWTISAIGNMGLEGTLKTATLRETTTQVNSQWTFKKGGVGLGIQSYQTISHDLQVGGTLNASWQAKKLGIFGLQFSYRESTHSVRSSPPILSGQTFYRFCF